MTMMLQLLDGGLKLTIINMLKELVKKADHLHEQMADGSIQ